MLRPLVLSLAFASLLAACSEDPAPAPDAGTPEEVPPDAGGPRPDGGFLASVTLAQLDGPETLKVPTGTTATFTAQVFAAGLTDRTGAAPGFTVEIGYGPSAETPTAASWKWVQAGFKDDVDGASPASNDRYEARLTLPAGQYDVAARVTCSLCAVRSPFVVDRDWSHQEYRREDATHLTVFEPAVGFCTIDPASLTVQLKRGNVDVKGRVWADGLTDATSGAAPANLAGELGVGPRGGDPRTGTGWSWTGSSFEKDQGNDDVFAASVTSQSLGVGSFSYAFRFRVGTGAWFFCDSDGNDGAANGFDLSKLGVLDVVPAKVDYASLEGPQNRSGTTGSSVDVGVLVFATGYTEGAGQGGATALQVEVGYGNRGTDPATHASWTFEPATYTGDVDGLNAGDKANDRYQATLSPPDGFFDAAARITLLGGPAVYVDLDGTGNGYQDAQALKLKLAAPTVDWCTLEAPASAKLQRGRDLAFKVTGQAYVATVTEATGQGAGITGELGVGPEGTDPQSASGWAWSAAAYKDDAQNNDRYEGTYAPATSGKFSYAFRFQRGTAPAVYCDLDGADGSAGSVSTSKLGALEVVEPTVDFLQLEGAAATTVGPGAVLKPTAVVYVRGITDRAGQGANVQVELGIGPAGGDVATQFTWTAATYKGDANGLGTNDNDRYEATFTAPSVDGTYDLAARALVLGGPVTAGDLDGSGNGYQSAQAVKVTVKTLAVTFCDLAPATATLQLGRGAAKVGGQVYAQSVTDAAGAGANLTVEAGYGPTGSDPRTTTGWTWSAAAYESDVGNNDQYAASLAPATTGTWAYALRARYGGSGAFLYCDTDGNAGGATGFSTASLGALTVSPPTVDFGQLEGSATRSLQSGQTATVSGVVYVSGVTDSAGKGADVAVELGRGARGTDPATHASWVFAAAAYKNDANGLGTNDNDRYEGTLASLPDGSYDVAMRASFKGGPWTYLDLDGSTNGYQAAQAIQLTVSTPTVGWCTLVAPTTASFQASRGAATLAGQVYTQGVTDASGAGAGIGAEVGYGPAGSDPRSASGWTWAAASYARDSGNDDVYEKSVGPTTVGSYAWAYRFRLGTTTTLYCDTDGNDGTTGGFDPAKLGALTVSAPKPDYAQLEGNATATMVAGGSYAASALVYASGITDAAGQGANVTVELGYGTAGTDPATDSSWRWTNATWAADVDGLNAGDKANDRYTASLTPPAGSWDVAARAKLYTGPFVFADRTGTTDGYAAADAVKLGVTAPGTISFASISSNLEVENVGAKAFVSGLVVAPGVTDSAGAGPGITADVGYGPVGTQPSGAGWTWTPAAYVLEAGSGGEVWGAWLTAPPQGTCDLAMRFTLNGSTTYADKAGSRPYSTAQAASLWTFAAGNDINYCVVQFPTSATAAKDSSFTIYGQVYVSGLTDVPCGGSGQPTCAPASGIDGQLVVGPAGSDPRTASGWSRSLGGPNSAFNFAQNNDEYAASARAPSTSGTYGYVWRFRRTGGWTYCDTVGNGANAGLPAFDPSKAGVLTVP